MRFDIWYVIYDICYGVLDLTLTLCSKGIWPLIYMCLTESGIWPWFLFSFWLNQGFDAGSYFRFPFGYLCEELHRILNIICYKFCLMYFYRIIFWKYLLVYNSSYMIFDIWFLLYGFGYETYCFIMMIKCTWFYN